MKKCLLVVIDALNARLVEPAMQQGRFPNLQQLVDAGQVRWNSVSIFPSITPAATSTLCTGKYPAEHRVLGAHFYDRVADSVHYFGSDLSVVMKLGFRHFFDDFLLALNHRCLDAYTLFDILEAGGLRCASINFLVFRGRQVHSARTPWLLRLIPTLPAETVLKGPEVLCVGDFVAEEVEEEKEPLDTEEGGLFARFGFNDRATGEYMLQLVDRGLPDFTIAYFPDTDFTSHEEDPYSALECIDKFDTWLGEFAQRFGGMEQMLQELSIVITGDHAQSDISPESNDAAIDLNALLTEFDVVDAGDPWSSDDQVMTCVNLRAAQIYLRGEASARRRELTDALLAESRIDQVIWTEHLGEDQPTHYHVATADRGKLTFYQANATDSDSYTDAFGGHWHITGDWTALDLRVDESRTIVDGDYPNALERIAMSFDPRFAGDMWVTSHVGYEFCLPRTSVHVGGGSHGSLHKHDSLSPLILAGEPPEIELPPQTRTVDVAPLCQLLTGHMPERDLGAAALRQLS